MITITERTPQGHERSVEAPSNRVRFAGYTERHARAAKGPPKLRVYYESEAEQSFAVLARFADGRYALQVTGGDLAVLLNGRPIVTALICGAVWRAIATGASRRDGEWGEHEQPRRYL